MGAERREALFLSISVLYAEEMKKSEFSLFFLNRRGRFCSRDWP